MSLSCSGARIRQSSVGQTTPLRCGRRDEFGSVIRGTGRQGSPIRQDRYSGRRSRQSLGCEADVQWRSRCCIVRQDNAFGRYHDHGGRARASRSGGSSVRVIRSASWTRRARPRHPSPLSARSVNRALLVEQGRPAVDARWTAPRTPPAMGHRPVKIDTGATLSGPMPTPRSSSCSASSSTRRHHGVSGPRTCSW